MRNPIFIVIMIMALNANAMVRNTSYLGKFAFTQKGKDISRCSKIDKKLVEELAKFKTCHAEEDEESARRALVAKCEKSDGSAAYIYSTRKACSDARADKKVDHGS